MSFQVLQVASLCSVVTLSSLSISRPAYALPNSALPEPALVSSLINNKSADSLDSREALLAEALSVAERIEQVDDKAIALAGIAQGYAKQGDLGRANSLLSQARQLAEQIPEPGRSQVQPKVLNKIADSYIAAGDEAAAAEVLLRSLDSVGEIRSQTRNYRYFLAAIERYGHFSEATLAQPGLEKAVELSMAIEDRFRRLYALSDIAIAYGQLEDAAIADAGISTVSALLLTANEAVSPRLQRINRNSALIDIAEARARAGNSAEAIALVAPVLDSESIYNLSKIASVYALLDDTAMAKNALGDLVLRIEGLPDSDNRYDLSNRLRTINNTAIAYIEIGEPAAAQSFLNSTLVNVLDPENPETLPYLSTFASTYALTGDISTQQALLKQAFELFSPSDLPEPNQLSAWQALGFEQMTQSYVQLSADAAPEQLALLLQIAEDNDWRYSYPVYLAMLSQAAAQRGDVALMEALHIKVFELLTLDDNGVPQNDSNMMLSTLIRLATVYGQTPHGQTPHGQTSETAVAIEGLRSLTEVAESLASAPDANPFKQQELLSAIAIAYASL